MSEIITPHSFCESLGLPSIMVGELIETLKRRELVELARQQARNQRCGIRPDNKALPFTEDGHEWARVEARIPKTEFFNLVTKHGWEGMESGELIKDGLKDNPHWRVETVSGKVQSGWTPGRKVFKRYNF